MSKPIKLTAELKSKAIEEFMAALDTIKMSDGGVSYKKNFAYKDEEKAKILFTPTAYAKMVGLLTAFSSEVAWHGVGERIEANSFLIYDIVVYPQTVTGVTVEMDTEKYAMWLMENDEDERFNHIIMQGHSHVNMGTSPSSVDNTHQEEILSQLSDDMFYIFMIWNKRLEHTTKIYDLQNNVMYEDGDIEYGIYDSDCDIESFVKDAKENMVVVRGIPNTTAKTYGAVYTPNYSNPQNYQQNKKTESQKSDKPSGKVKSSKKSKKDYSGVGNNRNIGTLYMDEEASDYFEYDGILFPME